jgi:hypothetical protein
MGKYRYFPILSEKKTLRVLALKIMCGIAAKDDRLSLKNYFTKSLKV